MERKRLIVITGPTATGKTALGAALGAVLDGEVISADSMQIYRGMDVGTAKPTPEEMRGVPHHMLDVADPREDWSVSRYVTAAAAAVEDVLQRGKTPLVVGGTGLYIEGLLRGAGYAPKGDEDLRRELGALYEREGEDVFRAMLYKADPEAEARIQSGDKKRLIRAMEVWRMTGTPLSEYDRRSRMVPPRYDSFRIALSFRSRDTLYRRIDRRVDEMLARGLEQEVRGLLSAGLSPRCTAMQAIGYKEVAAAIGGACTMAEAAEAVKRGSRRYAKRQLSWLRRDGGLHWLLWDEAPDIEAGVKCALEWISTENDTPPAV